MKMKYKGANNIYFAIFVAFTQTPEMPPIIVEYSVRDTAFGI